ncbi:MAG TPA: hypothetical protein VII00_02585 [bacterium]
MKEKIRQFYLSRTNREKMILLAGTACVSLIILFMVASPLINSYRKIDRMVSDKKEELLRVLELKKEYGGIDSISAGTKFFEKGTSLLGFLEGITSKIGMSVQSFRPGEGETYGKYKEINAEIKFAGISLQEVTELLYFLEYNNNHYTVWVKKLYLKTTFKDPNKLDVTINLGAYQYL